MFVVPPEVRSDDIGTDNIDRCAYHDDKDDAVTYTHDEAHVFGNGSSMQTISSTGRC